MGLLRQNMNKYKNLFAKTGGYVTDENVIAWLGAKRGIRRKSLGAVAFEKKSAVVIIGMSGVGKSTYAKNFIKEHPEFILCSHDDNYYQAVEEKQVIGNVAEDRMTEILEKKIRAANKNGQSIILDGMFIHPAVRAALFHTLKTFGYTIHALFFTPTYSGSVIEECTIRRSIESVLFKEYAAEWRNEKTITQLMEARERIIEIYAEKFGVDSEEVYTRYRKHPEVQVFMNVYSAGYQNELMHNGYEYQALKGFFMLGADYYYEL